MIHKPHQWHSITTSSPSLTTILRHDFHGLPPVLKSGSRHIGYGQKQPLNPHQWHMICMFCSKEKTVYNNIKKINISFSLCWLVKGKFGNFGAVSEKKPLKKHPKTFQNLLKVNKPQWKTSLGHFNACPIGHLENSCDGLILCLNVPTIIRCPYMSLPITWSIQQQHLLSSTLHWKTMLCKSVDLPRRQAGRQGNPLLYMNNSYKVVMR